MDHVPASPTLSEDGPPMPLMTGGEFANMAALPFTVVANTEPMPSIAANSANMIFPKFLSIQLTFHIFKYFFLFSAGAHHVRDRSRSMLRRFFFKKDLRGRPGPAL
jgi:hypothetical protein